MEARRVKLNFDSKSTFTFSHPEPADVDLLEIERRFRRMEQKSRIETIGLLDWGEKIPPPRICFLHCLGIFPFDGFFVLINFPLWTTIARFSYV